MKLIDGNEIKEITPELVAQLFCDMNEKEQAIFFNTVAEIASVWRGGSLAFQLQSITEDDGLTLAGRRAMQEIGEYSHWGITCKIIREVNQ